MSSSKFFEDLSQLCMRVRAKNRDMESEVVRRRMNMLAAHFAGCEDNMSPTHLIPMNCSSSLNSVIRRRDGKVYFARQGTASQAFFMRQVSTEKDTARRPDLPLNCSASPPLFSRPQNAKTEPHVSNCQPIQYLQKDSKSSAPDRPNFARPSRPITPKKQFHSKDNVSSSESTGIEWSPRMNVAESARNYIITVEVPGVNANDIRVEVDDKNLRVLGNRSIQNWRMMTGSKDLISAYHKREILQGPYQVAWPLPLDVKRDNVSAEFIDGLLQIIIPKV